MSLELQARCGMIAAMMLAWSAFGQTRVDLRTQSKSVDFGNAQSTRPVKTGTTLPATCGVGELYFVTNAPAGQNLYACVTGNTWSLASGGDGGLFSAAVEGTIIGTRPVANFVTGTGITATLVDAGTQINITQSANTAVLQTKAASQAGGATLCDSPAGSDTGYTCAILPTLGTYSTGMILAWKPGTSGAGGPTTLNIDTLGEVSVKMSDGATNPSAGDIVAGRLYLIWYDGTVFRMML